MGDYNPTAPYVLGEELVGILEESLTLTNASPDTEYGSTMVLASSQQVVDGRVYFPDGSYTPSSGKLVQVNIYPYGQEAATGPIQSIIVPVSTVSNSASGSTRLNVVGADGTSQQPPNVTSANIASALMSLGGSFTSAGGVGHVIFTSPNTVVPAPLNLVLGFDVVPYLPALVDKRILEVNILVKVGGDDASAIAAQSVLSYYVLHFPAEEAPENNIILAGDGSLQRIRLSDVNFLWNGGGTWLTQAEEAPWSVTQLANFAPTAPAGTHLNVMIQQAGVVPVGPNIIYTLDYVALEIVYCEETRVASGTILHQGPAALQNGLQVVPIRDMDFVASPTLPAGKYTVTVAAPYGKDGLNNAHTTDSLPPVNAIRALYPLTTHAGRQIVKPVNNYSSLGETLSVEDSDTMPQVSLHGSGGAVLPDVQVYGRRIEIPVYDQVTASQPIKNGTAGPASMTQARFYARRFGDTINQLLLTVNGVATASIAPGTLDALPEIIDGWREVTMRLSQAVAVNAGSTVNGVFSATGELAGNRWEVLGVTAPAMSGVAGNPYNRVPAAQGLTSATYLQPSGGTVALTWKSPAASGTVETIDTESDAVLLLSGDMPAGPALTVMQPSQTLQTVVACPVSPDGIVTGLTYQRITWTAVAVTGVGFGYYDLERMDTVDGAWQVIMRTSSIAVSGFNDYEARIGVQSSYRLRVANALGFYGPYSTTTTGTITAPGAAGTQVDNSLLTFTTNEHQAGASSMAYVTPLGGGTQEDLTFPEAGRLKLQWMFDRDYMSAFHPSERGGEQFTRTLLVQQMTTAGPQFSDAARGLRDLAWDDVTYVCVRNELGDRWFANVSIPSGNFQRNRALLMVQAQITEIQSIPSMVDPVTQQ